MIHFRSLSFRGGRTCFEGVLGKERHILVSQVSTTESYEGFFFFLQKISTVTPLRYNDKTRVEDFPLPLVFKTRVEVFSLPPKKVRKDGKFVEIVGERPLEIPLPQDTATSTVRKGLSTPAFCHITDSWVSL